MHCLNCSNPATTLGYCDECAKILSDQIAEGLDENPTYSDEYKSIRKKAKKWANYKVKIYNDSVATSKHAKKLKEKDT